MRTRVIMLALMLGWSGRAAQAQSPPPRVPPVRYAAPASCPDRDFFVERMRARLEADRVRALTSLSISVRLEAAGGSVHGSVQIDRGGVRARRTLEGSTCREVVEGLALIAALAVTAPARSESPKRRAPEPEREPAPEHEHEHEPGGEHEHEHERTPGQPGHSAATASPATKPPPTAASSSPLSSPTRARAPAAAQTATVPTRAEAEPEPPEEAEPSTRIESKWSFGASALAVHGLAPELQPGLQLQAALRWSGGTLDWTVRIAGRLALEQTQRSPDGSLAHFAFAAGAVQLCAGGAVGGSRVALEGCAVAEPGALWAQGEQTRNSQRHRRGWIGIGAGATLGWRAADWLVARGGAELLVPSRRDRMLLAGEAIHQVPPVCLRLLLGLEVPVG